MKILFNMFYIFYFENTHKVWNKFIEIYKLIEI